MTKYLSIFILTLSFSLNAQNEKNKLIHKDSTHEIYMMNSITVDNLWTLKVCINPWEDCKGFITEKDTSSTPYEQMNVRAIITKISDFHYKIEYKWRNSDKFLLDTFNVYCLDGVFCNAIINKDSIKANTNDYLNFDFMPASSDERDDVFITTREERIILYEKLK